MELWIRSQNKENLIKIKSLNAFDRNIMKDAYQDILKGIELPTMIIGNENINLGSYETKERALEILDEIQNKLLKSKYDKASEDYGKHSDYKDILIEISSSNYVYEMPKE